MSTRKRKKSTRTAKTSDKHELYQLSVQDPEQETAFVSRVFKKLRDRQPMSLREDFCGTAFSSAYWVESRNGRTALGIDLDSNVLDWGRRHNVNRLNERASRVELRRANVLTVTRKKFDVCLAMNFSYSVFKKREELVGYFRGVCRSLANDGMFFLDIYGGTEAQESLVDDRRVEDFTYEWEQASFNPLDSSVLNHIHFRFKDGSMLRRAFSYDWRLWQPIEVKEALLDAGFARVDFYWEDEDEDGDGTGTYRARKRVENLPGWLAFIAAAK